MNYPRSQMKFAYYAQVRDSMRNTTGCIQHFIAVREEKAASKTAVCLDLAIAT